METRVETRTIGLVIYQVMFIKAGNVWVEISRRVIAINPPPHDDSIDLDEIKF